MGEAPGRAAPQSGEQTALVDRLQRAIVAVERLARAVPPEESTRLLGKADGLEIALSYVREMGDHPESEAREGEGASGGGVAKPAPSSGPICELSRQPIFIDGRVPCHACGVTVGTRLVDALWTYRTHQRPAPPAARTPCIVDEDGGVCGEDDCPRCGAPSAARRSDDG